MDKRAGMRKIQSVRQDKQFLETHAAVQSLFNLSRYLVSANDYRNLRIGAFNEWSRAVV